jgi:hypothetical protein
VHVAFGDKPLEELAEGVPEVSAAVATRRIDRRRGRGALRRQCWPPRARGDARRCRRHVHVPVGDQPLEHLAEGDSQSQVSATVAMGREEEILT